jgi:spore germination cell wall hydrolase CwlJ-like protein
MSDPIQRQAIGDPLAFNPNSNASAPQLGMGGIGNPHQSGGDGYMEQVGSILNATAQIGKGIAERAAAQHDINQTEGQLKYMQGVSQDEIYKSGDKYTIQGWESLNTVDSANNFVLGQRKALEESGYKLSPEEFHTALMEGQKDALSKLPKDPAVRKMYVAQWAKVSPQLVSAHAEMNNTYNKRKTQEGFRSMLRSNSEASPDATRVMPGGSSLRLSATEVSKPMSVSAYDRDIGIRTLLGEGVGEGDNGMAAIAHVLKNRAQVGGYGGKSIAQVALARKQFSAWNPVDQGGNQPERWDANGKAYQRAARVFDAVMAGKVVDQTGGALNYFAPAGMKDGKNPHWNPDGKGLRIGGHIFSNSSSHKGAMPDNAGLNPAAQFSQDMKLPAMSRDRQDSYELSNPFVPPEGVAQEMGLPVTNPAGQVNADTYNKIMADTQPNDVKAQLLAEEMVANLEEDNNQLFNDAGGMATLEKLGATANQLRVVQKAQAAFAKRQGSKFNAAFEKEQEDVISGLQDGTISEEQAQQWVTEKYDAGQFNDQQAASMFHTVSGTRAAKAAAKGETAKQQEAARLDAVKADPVYQARVGNLLLHMMPDENGVAEIDYDHAVPIIQKLGKDYGLSNDMIAAQLTQARDTHLANIKAARGKMTKAAKDRVTYEEGMAEIDAAVTSGKGLGTLDGSIKAVDPDTGQVTSMSKQQAGVNMIKQQAMKDAQQSVRDGQRSPDQAAHDADISVARQLNRHGVVDKKMQAMMSAAGNPANLFDKDGNVTEDAKQAFNWYLNMSTTPDLGPQYAHQYLKNPEAEKLMATAAVLHTSNSTDLGQSLNAAKLQLERPKVDFKGAVKAAGYKSVAGRAEDVVRTGMTNEKSLWNWITGNTAPHMEDHMPDPTAVIAAVEKEATDAYSENPNMPVEAAAQIGVAKVKDRIVVVNGNAIMGDPDKGERLDQKMGIQGYGRDAPHGSE